MDINKIKGFAFDIDGVLTDGGVFCDPTGQLLRTFDAKDGFALRMATMNGYAVGVITGGSHVSIRLRMVSCGLSPENVYLASRNKLRDFKDFCARHGLDPTEVMFFGDDVPDIPVLRACGCGVVPSDGVQDAKDAAALVSTRPGGHGAVRQEVERVMKAQGRWHFDVGQYEQKF